MTGEWFSSRAGIDMTFVPYPGAPQGLQDVMGGRISAMVEGLAVFVGAHGIEIGQAARHHLAQAAAELSRSADGRRDLPGFNSRGWFAFMAFAGTPEDVVQKINADIRKVLEQPEVRQRFETLATYIALICRRRKPPNSSARNRTPGGRSRSNSAS